MDRESAKYGRLNTEIKDDMLKVSKKNGWFKHGDTDYKSAKYYGSMMVIIL